MLIVIIIMFLFCPVCFVFMSLVYFFNRLKTMGSVDKIHITRNCFGSEGLEGNDNFI